MRRMFWLGVGMATGVAVSRKARGAARKGTPAGVAENLGEAVHELAGALGAFGADVRAGMSEREEQLDQAVEERTGVSTGARAGARGAHVQRARQAGA